MDVVKDLLDKAVVDRNGREMGRVDGIALQARKGQPPRLAAILIGPAVLASRLHPYLGRCARTLEERLGLGDGRPLRVDFHDVADIDRKVRLRLTIGDTAADAVERRLRDWILKVPGSR
jgi:hypothetical protein